jgi:glycosyltransferase involved in cell wall biosynthesis
MAPSYPVPLRLLEERKPGISHARNAAIAWAMSHGADFMAFLDDDDIPEPDWLGHMLRRQTATNADIVIGACRSVFPPGTPQWLVKDSLYASSSLDLSRRFLVQPPGATTCICLLCASFMLRMGEAGYHFDEFFGLIGGGDTDFFARAAQIGATFAAADDAILNRYFTADRVTVRGWMRRKFRYGVSHTHVLRKYGSQEEIVKHDRYCKMTILRIAARLPRIVLVRRKRKLFFEKVGDLLYNAGSVYAHRGGIYHYYSVLKDDGPAMLPEA